jgi:hypothetical protein
VRSDPHAALGRLLEVFEKLRPLVLTQVSFLQTQNIRTPRQVKQSSEGKVFGARKLARRPHIERSKTQVANHSITLSGTLPPGVHEERL